MQKSDPSHPPGRQQTKVVIRRLPPTLSEEVLLQAVHRAVSSSQYNWIYFLPGKQSLKRTVNSAAFVDFKTAADVTQFASKFSNCTFTSEAGDTAVCHVQYAPYQRIPRSRPRRDPREGSLSTDRDYNSFVEKLNAPVELLPSAEVQLQAREKAPSAQADSKVVTPLMEYVRLQHMKLAAKNLQAAKSVSTVKKAVKPPRKAKDAASDTAQPKIIPIPLQGKKSGQVVSRKEVDSQSEKCAASGAQDDSGGQETVPKLLVRRRGGGGQADDADRQGSNATVPKRSEASSNTKKVRSGHQVYVPRSARGKLDTAGNEQTAQPQPSSAESSKQDTVQEVQQRRRRTQGADGQEGKCGRGRRGKGRGVKSSQ